MSSDLAAAVVEKAGSERLGPYLAQLLSAVAHRLSAATQTQVIQNLILVFARLSLLSAREVIDFLAQLAINGESGLQVVLTKWLENSVNFAGYDEIRQKYVSHATPFRNQSLTSIAASSHSPVSTTFTIPGLITSK